MTTTWSICFTALAVLSTAIIRHTLLLFPKRLAFFFHACTMITARRIPLTPRSVLVDSTWSRRANGLSHAVAGPSRFPSTWTHTPRQTRKGKEREIPGQLAIHPTHTFASSYNPTTASVMTLITRHQRRSFHASAKRHAIPLIPAAIGIFKVSCQLYSTDGSQRPSSQPSLR